MKSRQLIQSSVMVRPPLSLALPAKGKGVMESRAHGKPSEDYFPSVHCLSPSLSELGCFGSMPFQPFWGSDGSQLSHRFLVSGALKCMPCKSHSLIQRKEAGDLRCPQSLGTGCLLCLTTHSRSPTEERILTDTLNGIHRSF